MSFRKAALFSTKYFTIHIDFLMMFLSSFSNFLVGEPIVDVIGPNG